jgi:hypothetical protein
MSRHGPETAHRNIDPVKFAENWDHIFKKKEEKMSDGKYTNEMARQDTVEVCSSVYNDKIKQLEERLKDAEEVVAFYGERNNWRSDTPEGFNDYFSDRLMLGDSEIMPKVEDKNWACAGKRARAYQEKYQAREIVK